MYSNAAMREKLGKQLVESSLAHERRTIHRLNRMSHRLQGGKLHLYLSQAIDASEISCRRLTLGRKLLLTSDPVLPEDLPDFARRRKSSPILLLLLLFLWTAQTAKTWR